MSFHDRTSRGEPGNLSHPRRSPTAIRYPPCDASASTLTTRFPNSHALLGTPDSYPFSMRQRSFKNILLSAAIAVAAFTLGWFAASEPAHGRGRAADASRTHESEADTAGAAKIEHSGKAPAAGLASSREEVRSALQQLDQAAPCEQREAERLKLMQALAATDPRGAIDYAKSHLNRDRLAQALSAIATEWSKRDPVEAWKWVGSLGPQEIYHSHTVLEEIGRSHPEQALPFAAEFAQQHPDEAVAASLTVMRGMTEAGNFSGALGFADAMSLRSLDDKAVLMNFMAGQWARFDPLKAAEWVQSLPENALRTQALVGLGESWAEVDPPAAASFAAKLPAGEQRQLALRQAIANWIDTDPVKASNWVNAFEPSPDFDQAVASVATMRFLVENRVDTALSWANSIYDPALKLTALSEIVSSWSMRDHAAAVNYISTMSGLSNEARQQLLKQLQPSSG